MSKISQFINKFLCLLKWHDYSGSTFEDLDAVFIPSSEKFKRGQVWFMKCKRCGKWDNQEHPYFGENHDPQSKYSDPDYVEALIKDNQRIEWIKNGICIHDLGEPSKDCIFCQHILEIKS